MSKLTLTLLILINFITSAVALNGYSYTKEKTIEYSQLTINYLLKGMKYSIEGTKIVIDNFN